MIRVCHQPFAVHRGWGAHEHRHIQGWEHPKRYQPGSFATENTEVFFGFGSVIYGSDAIGGDGLSNPCPTVSLDETHRHRKGGNPVFLCQ